MVVIACVVLNKGCHVYHSTLNLREYKLICDWMATNWEKRISHPDKVAVKGGEDFCSKGHTNYKNLFPKIWNEIQSTADPWKVVNWIKTILFANFFCYFVLWNYWKYVTYCGFFHFHLWISMECVYCVAIVLIFTCTLDFCDGEF